jgi:molybdate transport system substrate-binding protein
VLHVPVIAVSKGGGKKVNGIEDLASPGLRVGLGAPEACAIGGTADRILERNGLTDAVKGNVCVRTATVNQLLVYLVTGHIDAAIVWADMIDSPEAAGKVEAVPIPREQNVVRTIAAARGARSEHPDLAADFIRHLASKPARGVWQKWGFTPCEE